MKDEASRQLAEKEYHQLVNLFIIPIFVIESNTHYSMVSKKAPTRVCVGANFYDRAVFLYQRR